MKTIDQARRLVNEQSPASDEEAREAMAQKLLKIAEKKDCGLEKAWSMESWWSEK